MTPLRLSVLVALLLLSLSCARTGDNTLLNPAVVPDDGGSGRFDDVPVLDLGVGGSDASVEDAGDDDLRSAPPIDTPERSDAMDRLYCEMDNGQLVQAALRAAACLDVSVAGVLDDASRGFVYGEVMLAGYAPATYGNCDYLRCLNNATTCEEAVACEEERLGEVCESFTSRCDGDVLVQCVWDGEGYREAAVQDCSRQGASCEPIDGEEAGCVGALSDERCGFYSTCSGDAIRRCTGQEAGSPVASEVFILCDELIDGGTCVETPVGGEAPGAACSAPAAECANSFAEGFACSGRSVMSLCLYGRIVEIDCRDYGYSRCVDDGFFAFRCE